MVSPDNAGDETTNEVQPEIIRADNALDQFMRTLILQ